MIGRLADQKGFDLVAKLIPQWAPNSTVQWVILGTGEPHYHQLFSDLAKQYPDKMAVRLGFSDELAHRIEAGADIFLMPSRYEPCGLNQLYSLKYGTVPVVHATGGLADTITNADRRNARRRHRQRLQLRQLHDRRHWPMRSTAPASTFANRHRLGATHSHRHAAGLVVEPQCPRIRPPLQTHAGPRDAARVRLIVRRSHADSNRTYPCPSYAPIGSPAAPFSSPKTAHCAPTISPARSLQRPTAGSDGSSRNTRRPAPSVPATNPARHPPVYEKLDAARPLAGPRRPQHVPAVDDMAAAVTPRNCARRRADAQHDRRAIGAHEVIIESAAAHRSHCLRFPATNCATFWRPTPSACVTGVTMADSATASYSRTKARGRRIDRPFAQPADRAAVCSAAVEAEQQRAGRIVFASSGCAPTASSSPANERADERIVARPRRLHRLLSLRKLAAGRSLAHADGSRAVVRVGAADELDRLDERAASADRRLESNRSAGAAYNLMLRTAPWIGDCDAWSHWRIELLPRVNAFAGLELATGIHINPLAPERSRHCG